MRVGDGRRRFLRWGVRGDGGKLKTDGDGQHRGEHRNPGGKLQGSQGMFGILGRRQGTPVWDDDPVQG